MGHPTKFQSGDESSPIRVVTAARPEIAPTLGG